LPLVVLKTSVTADIVSERAVLRVRIENPTDHLAFFVQLAATRGRGGPEILPIRWDDNYFSLLPHESREVTTILTAADLQGAKPEIEVGGWNIGTEFKCSDLKVSPADARAGEALMVSAFVADAFLDGSRATLYIDGRPANSQFVWARGDRKTEAKFTIQLPAGRHELGVGKCRTIVNVR